MTSAERYLPHYSVSDYQQWEGDWELWQGIPIAMTPSPFGPHQRMALKLAIAFENAIRTADCKAIVLQETDWNVSGDTVLRPDVVIVCGEVPREHLQSAPATVLEVLSPSTRARDLVAKKALYLRAGVKYCLVADPDEGSVRIATNDAPNWRTVEEHVELQVCETCKLAVDLTDLD